MKSISLLEALLVAAIVAAFSFLVFGCNQGMSEPAVIDGTGKLPPWVDSVWRDNVNGITCWTGGFCGSRLASCFRDTPVCPAAPEHSL